MNRQSLIDAVRRYAEEHYCENGWDIIAETFDDEELAEAIGRARTERGAIRKVAEHAGLVDERRTAQSWGYA